MPPKRKRSASSSNSEDQPSSKKLNNTKDHPSLHSLPNDCLSEILGYLPLLSKCAAAFTSKRLNDAFESFISRDLATRFGFAENSINLPKRVKKVLYPQGRYLAFEELIHLEAANDDENLEKQLSKLNNWTVLKISEKINSEKIKELNKDILRDTIDKVVYIDLAPNDHFALWEDSDGNTNGGKVHLSFFLFGQSEHFVEVTCDVLSYYEHPGGTFTCDLTLTAKLMDGKSPESIEEVEGLLEGYKELTLPDPESLEECSNDEDEEGDGEDKDDEVSEDSEEVFRKEVKNGDRVKVEWWHDCFPKLNHGKITQVLEWLSWKMSQREFAQVLTSFCFKPRIGTQDVVFKQYGAILQLGSVHDKDIDTSDTKASLEAITTLVLKDEDEWLNQVERTLDLLTAKIKLKNRIRNEWKKKDQAKLSAALTLIERSMYKKWSFTKLGRFDPSMYYKYVQGELHLISADPSKWVSFTFNMSWCRESDPDTPQSDDRVAFSISTSSTTGKIYNHCGAWTVDPSDIKLINDELGLIDFTDKEINELLAMAVDDPLDEHSV